MALSGSTITTAARMMCWLRVKVADGLSQRHRHASVVLLCAATAGSVLLPESSHFVRGDRWVLKWKASRCLTVERHTWYCTVQRSTMLPALIIVCGA